MHSAEGTVQGIAATSLTDTEIRAFLRSAALHAEMGCTIQLGLLLHKTTKGGSWRYRYRDAKGERRMKTVGTYPAMKAPQAAWLVQTFRHNAVDPLERAKKARHQAVEAEKDARRRTVGFYLENAYTHVQARKKTGMHELQRIREHFRDLLGRDMLEIRKTDIERWQKRAEAAGLKHATLRRIYGSLKTMVRHAHKSGVLATHPLQDVGLLPPTHVEKNAQLNVDHQATRRMLTEAERIGLLNGLTRWDQLLRAQRRNSRAHGKARLPDLDQVEFAHWFIPFCHLALHTGMRTGDLYSVTWRQLNVETARLQKFPEKTLHHADPIRLDLPLNAVILDIMRRWWNQCGNPAEGLVFPATDGTFLSKTAHNKPWVSVKRLGGLPGDLVFYALRHNFISTMLHLGVPIFEVARLVGHKSALMIERNYGHLCPAAAASSMQAFGQAMTGETDNSEV